MIPARRALRIACARSSEGTDTKTLDEYAGVYEDGAGTSFTFARKGDDLTASQARDIVFTPGHGTTPKVFQRDASGKVTGFICLRGQNSVLFKRAG